jgi:hypothetical protein
MKLNFTIVLPHHNSLLTGTVQAYYRKESSSVATLLDFCVRTQMMLWRKLPLLIIVYIATLHD